MGKISTAISQEDEIAGRALHSSIFFKSTWAVLVITDRLTLQSKSLNKRVMSSRE
jgi:hypothetical protein